MFHFALHIGDYVTATAHLSMLEDGAYNRLLRRYYQDEKPLPKEVSAVQRLVGARSQEERDAVEVVLGEFFVLRDDGWHQTRADEEIAGYRARAEIARENGRKSGANRKPKPNPSGTEPVPQSKPSGTPAGTDEATQTGPSDELTVNRKPIQKERTDRAAPSGRTPDEKPCPIAAREDGPVGADAHDDKLEFPSFLKRVT